jgi:hypothetical protein
MKQKTNDIKIYNSILIMLKISKLYHYKQLVEQESKK